MVIVGAKLLISGPPGAGKTTAIAAISEIPPIRSEVLATDELAEEKTETTVGLDFGQVTLDDGETLAIYGTPGQIRFSFMWDILLEGTQGLILLLNHQRPDSLGDLAQFAEPFRQLFANGQAVIGISRFSEEFGPGLHEYADALAKLSLQAPLIVVDVRERDDVLLLLETLVLQNGLGTA